MLWIYNISEKNSSYTETCKSYLTSRTFLNVTYQEEIAPHLNEKWEELCPGVWHISGNWKRLM